MKTQHTPGPWNLGVRKPTSDKFIYGAGGAEIADCDRMTNFPDQNLANARLIAAAPELLAALLGLLADPYLADPINADRMAHARAAIAKATGHA